MKTSRLAIKKRVMVSYIKKRNVVIDNTTVTINPTTFGCEMRKELKYS